MNSWTTGWILSGLSHLRCLNPNFRYWVPFSFFKSDHLFSATSPYSFTSITYISEGSVAYFTIKPIWSSKCYYLVESLTIIALWIISYPSPVHTVTVEQHNIKSISFHEKLTLSDCWLLFPKLSGWCRQLMNETLRSMNMFLYGLYPLLTFIRVFGPKLEIPCICLDHNRKNFPTISLNLSFLTY